jgi:hypothetical protein
MKNQINVDNKSRVQPPTYSSLYSSDGQRLSDYAAIISSDLKENTILFRVKKGGDRSLVISAVSKQMDHAIA